MKINIRFLNTLIKNFFVLFLFFTVWELSTYLFSFEALVIPPPTKIFTALFNLANQGVLFNDALASLKRVFVGFSIATLVGVSLGVTMSISRKLTTIVRPVIEILRPIPAIAWIPISLLWFGFGDPPAYFIVFLGSFFPIVTNSFFGVRSIEKSYLNAAYTLGVKGNLLFKDVIIPAALPSIFTGLKIGMGVGWICVITAELVGSQSGLGYMIQLSRAQLQMENVLAGMVTIGIIGFCLNGLMSSVERFCVPWRRSDREIEPK